MEKKNQKKGYQIKTDYNLVDKGDFPELVEKKEEIKRSDQFKEVIQTQKQKPATYQKKINEMFPTLGGDAEPKEEPKKEVRKVEAPKQQEQKAWWEKINEKKKSPD